MTPTDIIHGDGARLRNRQAVPGATGGWRVHVAGAQRSVPGRSSFARLAVSRRKPRPTFLALPNVVCVGGSWLTPKAALAAQNWEEVTRLAQSSEHFLRRRQSINRSIGATAKAFAVHVSNVPQRLFRIRDTLTARVFPGAASKIPVVTHLADCACACPQPDSWGAFPG